MNVTEADLRRRYRALETTELLGALESGGLTGVASAVLQETLESRNTDELQSLLQSGTLSDSASAVLQTILEARGILAETLRQQMAPDFREFLRETAKRRVPDQHGDLNEPAFSAAVPPVAEAALQALEQRIEATLPASYKMFLKVLGPGSWCWDHVLSPEEVLVFDEPRFWEMQGFVGIVYANGVGDYLAFNPADPEREGERTLYYCGHDPFGYAPIADSFEEWAREVVVSTLKGENFYDQFDDAVYKKWKEYSAAQPKRWWQFWR